MTRPGFGSTGQPVGVLVNHFPVTCDVPEAQHYDVDIQRASRYGELGPATPPSRPQRPIAPDTCRCRAHQSLTSTESHFVPRIVAFVRFLGESGFLCDAESLTLH